MFVVDERLFHTAWFVESLATQVLVIFIIRTARPHPLLIASSLSAVFLAVIILYSPIAAWLGFVPIPGFLVAALTLLVLLYLLAVHLAKSWLFARYQLG
jgi:Mg2+-importing ATPase